MRRVESEVCTLGVGGACVVEDAGIRSLSVLVQHPCKSLVTNSRHNTTGSVYVILKDHYHSYKQIYNFHICLYYCRVSLVNQH